MSYYDTDVTGKIGIYVWYTNRTTGIIWMPGLKGADIGKYYEITDEEYEAKTKEEE